MRAGHISDRRRLAQDIEAFRRLDYDHNQRLAEEYRRQREKSARCASSPTPLRYVAGESRTLFFGATRGEGHTSWRPLVLAIRAARRVLRETGGRARDVAALAAAVASADSPAHVREAVVSALWRLDAIGADEARRYWFYVDNGTFPAWQLW